MAIHTSQLQNVWLQFKTAKKSNGADQNLPENLSFVIRADTRMGFTFYLGYGKETGPMINAVVEMDNDGSLWLTLTQPVHYNRVETIARLPFPKRKAPEEKQPEEEGEIHEVPF